MRFIAVVLVIWIRFFQKKTPKSKYLDWNKETFSHSFKDSEPDQITLGISSYFHDSSVTFVKNDEILWAAQEERFNRIKNTNAFPRESMLRAFKDLNISTREISKIVYFEDPNLKFQRIKNQIQSTNFFGSYKIVKENLARIIKYHIFFNRQFTKDLLDIGFSLKQISNSLYFSNHHLSHAISAFKPSPFIESAVVVVDAVGEDDTVSIWHATALQIDRKRSISFPNSLGMFYSAFTHFCGFNVNSGEYKLMGLSPFGIPVYKELILEHVLLKGKNGFFTINPDFLTYENSTEMYSESKLEKLLGLKKREPESMITQEYMNLASSVQEVLNECMIELICYAKKLTGSNNLCLAGGVALNCVANSRIYESKIFEGLWVQPAAGDAGTSLGAAMFFGKKKETSFDPTEDSMKGAFLGSQYSNEEIEEVLQSNQLVYSRLEDENIIENCVSSLQNYRVVGWFQGKMEFGPRSLGARSIIANARDPYGQKRINMKIKFRESFRPFAPALLKKTADHYFRMPKNDKYMLFVAWLKSEFQIKNSKTGNLSDVGLIRSKFPSITHMDYSARLQVVDKCSPIFNLISHSTKKGIPIIVNTSFNVRGEPIVESPLNAIICFMTTEMDDLFIGNFHLKKESQITNQLKYKSQLLID